MLQLNLFCYVPEPSMDQVKAEGKKKNLSARLERRKKWWAEKKANTRLTRGINPNKPSELFHPY